VAEVWKKHSFGPDSLILAGVLNVVLGVVT